MKVSLSPSESSLQKSCIKWFRLQYPALAWHLFAIPNGGSRNAREARSLKLEGVLSGVSDLFLALPCHSFHGFFIELKVGYNKPTKNQAEFMKYVEQAGYNVAVIYTIEEFMAIVKAYIQN